MNLSHGRMLHSRECATSTYAGTAGAMSDFPGAKVGDTILTSSFSDMLFSPGVTLLDVMMFFN
jgi:hypothetical protein